MCRVCVEWEAGKLTSKEALRNLGEMFSDEEDRTHLFEASEKILNKEVPMEDLDEEMDKNWHEETHEN